MALERNVVCRIGCLALIAAIASSCGDQLLQPTSGVPDFSKVASESAQEVGDRHLVLFRGNGVPEGFAADVAALGGSVEFSHAAGVAIVSGLPDAAAAALARSKQILEVQRDGSFRLDPIVPGEPEPVFDGRVNSPSAPGNAAAYARQWNMRAVKADQAWAAGRTGSAAVTIAILDTGIDYGYVDLQGRVDLDRSVSFIPTDDALVDAYFHGRHPVTDLFFHGTHVAATAVSNSYVVAGITSKTTLMGVKVCGVYQDDEGDWQASCPFSAVIMGVLHAVDNGADVINMSLGGWFPRAGNGWYVGFINSVFNYANAAGVTVVVSAGNDNWDLDHDGNEYTTYCDAPNVLCVAATGPTAGGTYGPWTDVDARAPYSNYGRSAISVAAPGGTSDGGWVWSACSQTSLAIPVCATGIYVIGAYGTSMAAPHVAGLAALMVEDYGRNPARVRTRIMKSADDLGRPGVDPYYGRGRINVASAVNN